MNCPSCGSENAVHRRYCGKCGRPMGSACGRCAFFNTAGDAWCGGCGVKLEAGAEASASVASPAAFPLSEEMGLGDDAFREFLPRDRSAPGGEPQEKRVSPSEIDALFKKMDEESSDGV